MKGSSVYVYLLTELSSKSFYLCISLEINYN